MSLFGGLLSIATNYGIGQSTGCVFGTVYTTQFNNLYK